MPINLFLKNGSTVLWKHPAWVRFNLLTLVLFVGLGAGCYSASEDDSNKNHHASSTSLWALFGDYIVSGELAQNDEAVRIAQSYPVPEIPIKPTPFEVQPDTRFEQWVLSSMRQDTESQTWTWTRQEFFRVALLEKKATRLLSNWAFTDIVGQRFTEHTFGNAESVTDESVERVALDFASVANGSIKLNDISLTIDSDGCQSALKVGRKDDIMVWKASSCPDRVLANGSVAGQTDQVLSNGFSRVTHVYGQLPSDSGAVIIDRLDVLMPNGQWLKINRSRRRSGTGPVTIVASAGSETLNSVDWVDNIKEGDLLPKDIRIHVPSLSQTFLVSVPNAINREAVVNNMSVQYGVTVTSSLDESHSLPGILVINPLQQREL